MPRRLPPGDYHRVIVPFGGHIDHRTQKMWCKDRCRGRWYFLRPATSMTPASWLFSDSNDAERFVELFTGIDAGVCVITEPEEG